MRIKCFKQSGWALLSKQKKALILIFTSIEVDKGRKWGPLVQGNVVIITLTNLDSVQQTLMMEEMGWHCVGLHETLSSYGSAITIQSEKNSRSGCRF